MPIATAETARAIPAAAELIVKLATGLLIVSAAFLVQLAIHVAVVVPEAEAARHVFLQ